MKAARGFPIAVITDKNAATVTSGHPWIYEDEIISIDSTGNGSLVAPSASDSNAIEKIISHKKQPARHEPKSFNNSKKVLLFFIFKFPFL